MKASALTDLYRGKRTNSPGKKIYVLLGYTFHFYICKRNKNRDVFWSRKKETTSANHHYINWIAELGTRDNSGDNLIRAGHTRQLWRQSDTLERRLSLYSQIHWVQTPCRLPGPFFRILNGTIALIRCRAIATFKTYRKPSL